MVESLLPSFFLALFSACFSSAYLGCVKIIPFAPFFVILILRKPLLTALSISVFCGTLMDLLSSDTPFGIYALNYCLTTLLLYRQKRNFLEDKPLSFSLFTLIYSLTSALILGMLIKFYGLSYKLPLGPLSNTLLLLPLLDAFYAFIWFTCPLGTYALAVKFFKGIKLSARRR